MTTMAAKAFVTKTCVQFCNRILLAIVSQYSFAYIHSLIIVNSSLLVVLRLKSPIVGICHNSLRALTNNKAVEVHDQDLPEVLALWLFTAYSYYPFVLWLLFIFRWPM